MSRSTLGIGAYAYEPVPGKAATWATDQVYAQLTSKPGPACGLS